MTRDGDRPIVAIAHDYLTQRGGAERVVLALTRIFPEAPVYTTLFDPAGTFPEFSELDVRPSPLNRVRALREHHRRALLALPFASRGITIDADVVIASSSGWAHGFGTTGAKLVYCYTPARWLYQSDRYLGDSSGVAARGALAGSKPLLVEWDRRAAKTADRYLAISTEVSDRIHAAYGRDSTVVPAPHSMDPTGPQHSLAQLGIPEDARGFFLCLSRLLPYKNVDRVIAAFASAPDRRLIVVGSGPEERRLAEGLPANVTMVKDLSDAQLRWLYARCRAVLSASHEDFGLTPLEAAAFGAPSVVLRGGGFLDTVVDGATGVFFEEPTAESVRAAVERSEKIDWDAALIRRHAARFSESVFADTISGIVAETVERARVPR